LEPHKPSFGTDQLEWPDGTTTPRSYFSDNPETVKSFAPEHGQPVILRTAKGNFGREAHTGDRFSTENIPSKDLEFLGVDNGWHSVLSLDPFPLAEDVVGGLKVRSEIPNMSSISGSYNDYEILQGVRKFDISDWAKERMVTVEGDKRVRQLVTEIDQTKEINPLIVAIDADGEPWIMEGSHRFHALQELGVTEIPALIVKEIAP